MPMKNGRKLIPARGLEIMVVDRTAGTKTVETNKLVPRTGKAEAAEEMEEGIITMEEVVAEVEVFKAEDAAVAEGTLMEIRLKIILIRIAAACMMELIFGTNALETSTVPTMILTTAMVVIIMVTMDAEEAALVREMDAEMDVDSIVVPMVDLLTQLNSTMCSCLHCLLQLTTFSTMPLE